MPVQTTTLHEPTFIERFLIFLNPLWAWLGRHFPKVFGPPATPQPFPSAMLLERNFIYRALFPRFLKQISVDEAAVQRVRADAEVTTIVYLARSIGQLEYHYFNHLFIEKGLPLAAYTNALTLRRWMPFGAWWRSLNEQERQISERGRPLDPITDGLLTELIAGGRSVLLRIPSSDIEAPGFVATAPLRALLSIIAAQRGSSRPIAIVPLDFLWNRRPRHAKRSLIDALFGESETPGRLRKFVLFWRNYKLRAQAFIGTPIEVSQFLSERQGRDDETLARELGVLVLSKLTKQKRTITGPPLRPRSWFIQEVLSDEALDREICQMAAERGKSADDTRELAQRYAKEIISDLDYSYVEPLDRLLNRTLVRLFEKFDVDSQGLARAKALLEQGPVVFSPNHRSHADYLIISHILYHRGIAIPHVAAGSNLSFWPLGNIFRHCGAYFIRRTFQGNRLYRDVLKTYLKVLLKEGHSQEFFLEGGRSRTGKLRQPKMGLLAMYHEAAHEAGVHNMTFLPVAVTYDHVVEYGSYVRELEGAGKEKERRGHLLRLTKFVRRKQKKQYGTIYVRFGEPLAPEGNGSDPKAIEAVAHRICLEINRHTVATASSIAAAALLAVSRGGITEPEFMRNAQAIIAYLSTKGVEIPSQLLATPNAVMRDAIDHFSAQKLAIARRDALEPFIAIDESRRVPLSYFRNGIAHFLVTIGVVSCLLEWHARRGHAPSIDEIARDLEGCQHLLLHEFRFATRPPIRDHVVAAVGFLAAQGAVEERPEGTLTLLPAGSWILQAFAAQVRPCVETLWIAHRYVEEKVKSVTEERTLVNEMLKTGQDLFLLGRVRFRESVTKDGLISALAALVTFGVLTSEKSSGKRGTLYSPSQNPDAVHNLKVELEKVI